MSFVRIKNISDKEYGYLVENYWTSSGSRQKTKEYLGRVLSFAQVKEITYELTQSMSYKELVRYLIAQELRKHGFHGSKDEFTHGDVRVNIVTGKCTKRGRDIVIKINDGFLCSYTFNQLLSFIPEEEKFEHDLANHIVAAGIDMPPEMFITVYEAAKRKLKKDASGEE